MAEDLGYVKIRPGKAALVQNIHLENGSRVMMHRFTPMDCFLEVEIGSNIYMVLRDVAVQYLPIGRVVAGVFVSYLMDSSKPDLVETDFFLCPED